MKTRWYLGTLIIFLALIGLSQKQSKSANQQIVFQFADTETTAANTYYRTLAAITQKLESLGISNIEVIESDDTQLSLRYYSDIDAQGIREFLSKVEELSLALRDIDQTPIDSPTEELPETCSLVVLDLQEKANDGLSLNGKFASEINQDYKRFSNTVVLRLNSSIVTPEPSTQRIAYKISKDVALTIENELRTIPEVRAGPQFV